MSEEITSSRKRKREKTLNFELNRNLFNDVRHQIDCGCCYAMVATAICETHYLIRHSQRIQLSPQEFADCIHDYIYHDPVDRVPDEVGCKLSSVIKCFRYMKKFGISLEDDYPYQDKKGDCKRPVGKLRLKLKYFKILDETEEEKILRHLRQFPIACGIEIFSELYWLKDEIYQGPKPPEEGQEAEESTGYHFMLIVGFGVQDNIKYYWVRNSWGVDWGVQGYGKIARDQVQEYSYPGKMELTH